MREGATEAVLEFLGDTRVSCRTATRAIGPREEEGQAPEGEEGGASEEEEGGTPPLSVFSFVFSLFLSLSSLIFPLFGGIGRKEIRLPQYGPGWFGTGFGHVEKPPLSSR